MTNMGPLPLCMGSPRCQNVNHDDNYDAIDNDNCDNDDNLYMKVV